MWERRCTGVVRRMPYRKWRETKQQPSRARSGYQLSCSLVSLHPAHHRVAKISKQNGMKKLILQVHVSGVLPCSAPRNNEGVVIVGCPMKSNFKWIVVPWKRFSTEASTSVLRKMGCPKNDGFAGLPTPKKCTVRTELFFHLRSRFLN